MNSYEAKQAARRERYAERAAKLRRQADATHTEAREMADVIPFGQPILVGHHSEKRDRNYRKRINNKFRKSFETMDKAKHYEAKATTTSRAISGDDPDAIQKLQNKLARLEARQEHMKTVNWLIRKKDIPALVVLVGKANAAALQKPDFCGRIGYADFELTNNNANIRRIKGRIASLERAAETPPADDVTGDGFTIQEDAEDNRVLVIFDKKPPRETCSLMRSHGFKWSPTRGAWCRMLNSNGRFAADQVAKKLGRSTE